MAEWPTKELGELCKFVSGGTPNRKRTDFYEGPHPWVSSADISEDGTIIDRRFISTEAIKQSPTSLVPAGTVLLVTRTGVGKVTTTNKPRCFSQDITALTEISSSISPDYLVWCLRQLSSHLKQIARGVTIKGLSRTDIEKLPISLPPLEEQQRIAGLLAASSQSLAIAEKRSTSLLKTSTALLTRVINAAVSSQSLEAVTTIQGGSTPSKSKPNYWLRPVAWCETFPRMTPREIRGAIAG